MKQSVRSFGANILIETIAVFIGITLALIIDNYQESRREVKEIHNHLELLETQLIRDTFQLADMEKDLGRINSSIDSAVQLSNYAFAISKTQDCFVYKPPIELLNALVNSNSFSTIYDSIIFNSMCKQMADFNQYIEIQVKIDEVQKNFVDEYVYPYKDFQTGEIEINTMVVNNRIMNELFYLRGLYEIRYSTLQSMQTNYRRLLNQIVNRIH